jgi:hypothetical protein
MRTPIRHGDVMLLPVDAAPAGIAERVTTCIVGQGESGHQHVLAGDREFATIVSASGSLYVDLGAPTRLSDHEDRELEVPSGTWRVVCRMAFPPHPGLE